MQIVSVDCSFVAFVIVVVRSLDEGGNFVVGCGLEGGIFFFITATD